MIVHNIVPLSEVNGEGKRFVIWVQGCSRNCPGCFNPDTYSEKNRGTIYSVEEIFNLIDFDIITGITVSGGEPFDQPCELYALLEKAYEKKLHTLVYSGYTFEELEELDNDNVKKALTKTDMLIDGAYKQEIAPVYGLTGSGNQRVLVLKNGKVVEDVTEENNSRITGEIIINNDGTIISTGFFDGRNLN